jgi:hypothetical protein
LPSVTTIVHPEVNISQTPGNQHEGVITVDPTNPQHLFAVSNSATPTGVFTSRSFDGGVTWTPQVIANGSDNLPIAGPNFGSGFGAGVGPEPDATYDQYGNLYVTYMVQAQFQGNIEVALSTDGGRTFANLHLELNGFVADQPTLAAGPNSVWLYYSGDNDDKWATGATVSGLGNVGPFTPRTEILTGASVSGDIAVGPQGQVLVTWQPFSGSANVFESRNPTGLAGAFGPGVTAFNNNVGNGFIFAGPQTTGILGDPELAWDRSPGPHNGRVYLAYVNAPTVTSSDTNIFVRYSDDSGVTWSSPVQVNDDQGTNSQFNPTIDVDPVTGEVAVSWLDARNDTGTGGAGDTDGKANTDAEVFAAFSADGGQTFSPNVQVATRASNGPDAMAFNGTSNTPDGFALFDRATFYDGLFYRAWADNSNFTADNPDGQLHAFDLYTAQVEAFVPITISGTVYNDLNGDGSSDGGTDPGLGNVIINLYRDTNNNGIFNPGQDQLITSTTSSSVLGSLGQYSFTNVPRGTYFVQETAPAGFTQTQPATVYTVHNVGVNVANDNFGNFQDVTITGRAYVDVNNLGSPTPSDPGLNGVTIQLYRDSNRDGKLDAGDAIVTTATTSTIGATVGAYSLSSAGPGRYFVAEIVPPGYTQTAPSTPTYDTVVTAAGGASFPGRDFGNFKLAVITGQVFNDVSGSGNDTGANPGLNGVTVRLYADSNKNGVFDPLTDTLVSSTVSATVNGQAGGYSLATQAGTFFVVAVPSGTNVQTFPTTPATYYTFSPAQSGLQFPGTDFGIFQQAQVTGRVFLDQNGDGADNGGTDPGVNGVIMDLFRDVRGNGVFDPAVDTLFATTTTSTIALQTGQYAFTVPAGKYLVTEVLPSGYTQTFPVTPTYYPLTVPGGTLTGLTFGIYQNISVSGRAYTDTTAAGNDNGGTDLGLNGIKLDLFKDNGNGVLDASDTVVGTVTTTTIGGRPGRYTFSNIGPGVYFVQSDQAALTSGGYTQTSPPTATLLTNYYPVISNQSGSNFSSGFDFGEFKLGVLAGQVYQDFNGDGFKNGADAGLQGWTVDLLDTNNVVLTSQQTDQNGNYSFGVLPGTYRVREETMTGWNQTTADPADVTVAVSGTVPAAMNFGNFQRASISGLVFADQNGDGTLNGPDAGLFNWTVQLIDVISGNVVASTTTDGNGNYSFTDLGPGTFLVREVIQNGWVQSNTNPPPFFIISGTNATNVDFGNFLAITIGGQVFEDRNGNAAQDSGEPGLSNWTVQLIDQSNGHVLQARTTDGNGNFTFPNVGPGISYDVREVAQSGWVQTTPNPANIVVNQSGINIGGVNFGNFHLATVSGEIFQDLNGNGQLDATDAPQAGWTVQIVNLSTGNVVASPVSDQNGNYTTTSPPIGHYRVLEVVQPGFQQTTPLQTVDLSVTSSGNAFPNINFGNFAPVGVSGQVFLDHNGDGQLDGADTGMANILISLINKTTGNVAATQNTDSNGNFSIANILAGTYQITEAVPAGFVQTTANPPDIVVTSGHTTSGISFGNFQAVTIGGQIFLDRNGNGTQDSGEPPLVNWTVQLTNTGTGVVTQTGTDPSGNFLFTNVGPGTYRVRQVPPAGWLQTTPNPADIVVSSSVNVANIVFGSFQGAAVSGHVFQDQNGDGVQGANDTGFGGLTVQALDAVTNNLIQSQVTDSSGNYQLALGPGTYKIRQLLPAGVQQTTADPANISVVTSGSSAPGVNFGDFKQVKVSGRAFIDLNGDGTDNGGTDPGAAGMTVELDLDSNANGVFDPGIDKVQASQAIGADGNFTLNNVGPGQFVLRILKPAGQGITTPPGGTYVLTTQSGTDISGDNFGILPSQTATFVHQVYLDLLGRPSDPTGYAFWTSYLNNGGSRSVVVQGIQASPEYAMRNINKLYEQYLLREADPAGMAFCLQVLSNPAAFVPGARTGLDAVKAALLSSQEYFNVRGSGTYPGFMTNLFHDVLGRDISVADSNSFVNLLAKGQSRLTIALLVVQSPEGTSDVVESYYLEYLRRPADQAGLAFWTSFLLQGNSEDTLVLALVSSNEYLLRL